MKHNAELVEKVIAALPAAVQQLARETAATLHELSAQTSPNVEDLERRLTVLEEKLLASLLASTADDALMAVRADADRELASFRGKMNAAQIDQLMKQYVHKRLLERYKLPRLSLFYMP